MYDKIITGFHLDPLLHFKYFSKNEYSRLTERELADLRRRYSQLKSQNEDMYNEIETFHQILSDGMQANYDREYGRGKYTVIVLGRSLSSVGKVLGYKIGEEYVKNVPLSQAQKYLYDRNIAKERGKGLDDFKKYLESVGLSKKEISKSNKHKYILVDFCYSGSSIDGANSLLQSPDVYGKRKNIKTDDVVQTCISDAHTRVEVLKALFLGKYKELSFVKYCSKLSKTNKSVRKPQKANDSVKLTWFNLMDKVCSK